MWPWLWLWFLRWAGGLRWSGSSSPDPEWYVNNESMPAGELVADVNAAELERVLARDTKSKS